MYMCGICQKMFTRHWTAKMHSLSVHPGQIPIISEVPNQISQTVPQVMQDVPQIVPQTIPHETQIPTQEPMIYQHPFTMCVSGPTSCGKTFWVKSLLQLNKSLISPPPNRILWFYRRWQPLYDVIKETVFPPVEFIQGIPQDIEEDQFLNPMQNNLIILDDLMSTSAKDPKINNLFTEGSHHRNLSVIAINQNLYYNKDPTQRRNCHYLVLFNNPIDKQQMMTLARQMYPDQSQFFLAKFERATATPYGHLIVDLKPRTSANKRLLINPPMINAYRQTSENYPNGINTVDHRSTPHLSMNNPRHKTMERTPHPSCDDCGMMFDGVSDLVRHAIKWCPEREGDSDAEQPLKKQKVDEREDICDNTAYKSMYNSASDNIDDEMQRLYNQYIDEGMTLEQAEDKARTTTNPAFRKAFFKIYAIHLGRSVDLESNPIHRGIVEDIETITNEGLSLPKAARRVLRNKKHLFEDFLLNEDDTELTDDE